MPHFNRILLGFFVSLLFLYASNAHAEREEKVKIACNVPLTGPLATYGKAVQEGVEMALAELPVGSGKELLHFDWQDNRSLAREAVTIARKQMLSDPDIYVSGVRPQYTAIREQVRQAGMPHFVWIFDRSIRSEGEPNFRTYVNFKVEPALFIDYARKIESKRIGIIYVQLPNTDEEYQEDVIPGLRKAGFNDLKVETYQMDKNSFDDIALRMKEYQPDLFILSGFQENLVNMVRALRRLKLLKEGNAVASYDLIDAAQLLSSAEVEGLRVSAPAFLLRRDKEPVAGWLERFEKRYNYQPTYTAAYAYDMALILAHAARQVSSDASHEEWADAISDTEINGITGRIRFDDSGDLMRQVELGVFRSGKLVAAGDQ